MQRSIPRDPPESRWDQSPAEFDARLETVREYAARIFGKEIAAAAWLGQPNAAVLNAACTVAEACRTYDGFLAAMLELTRINHRRHGFG